MNKILLPEYIKSNITELIDLLKKNYYDTIVVLCQDADGILKRLLKQDENPSITPYLDIASQLLEQTTALIAQRVDVLMPYIYVLNKKDEEHHDCSTCNGKCSFQHVSHLSEINESHQRLKEILYKGAAVALPLYSDNPYPDEYKALRKEMMLLNTALTQLFYLEEAYLVPKIKDIQKHIHASA